MVSGAAGLGKRRPRASGEHETGLNCQGICEIAFPSTMASFSALSLLLCCMLLMAPATLAQPAPPSAPAVTCTLPNTSMISPNFCNAYDEQVMASQTQGCAGFLTDAEPSPAASCCAGLNTVAANRTACLCKFTFFPPQGHDEARQLDLPRLCGVTKNLCGQCPTFLVSSFNAASPTTPVADPPADSEEESVTSALIALSIAAPATFLLAVVVAVLIICFRRKRLQARAPPEACEIPPPGGAF